MTSCDIHNTMELKYIQAELSTASAFEKGFVCRCNTCASLFAKQPQESYCPVCKHYNLDRSYKQIPIYIPDYSI